MSEDEYEVSESLRDPLFVTPKDYLKNYLEMVTPFYARPIKALGGACSDPSNQSGKIWVRFG